MLINTKINSFYVLNNTKVAYMKYICDLLCWTWHGHNSSSKNNL